MTIRERIDKLEPQRRAFSMRGKQIKADAESRTVRFSFSSEEPVDMWYGTEILSHAPGAMRCGQRQETMPLLFNHDMSDLLGVVEAIGVGTDRKGYADVRFGKDARGDWAMQQYNDDVLVNVSFMYRVFKFLEDTETEIYTATDWEPYEVSLVTVPADSSVGKGRAVSDTSNTVITESRSPSASAAAASAVISTQGDPDMKRHFIKQDQETGGTGTSGGAATIDTSALRASAVADERARSIEIEAMCRTHKLPDDFRNELVNKGYDIAECRGRVLIELGKRGTQPPLSGGVSTTLGLSDKEQRAYSLMRAINSVVNGDWSKAGFEREVSVELAKRNGKEGGGRSFFFPNDLPFAPTQEHMRAYRAVSRRAAMAMRAPYQVGVAGQGGNLVETNLMAESFIEVLRAQTVTSLLGATYLPGLVGNVDIPRRITATGTYWVGESAAPTESEATFDKVSLRPKTIGALSKVSRLMLMQSTPAIEMLTRRDLMLQGALAIDQAALSGSGTGGAPTGIINQAGVNSVVGGVNGAALTFDHIIQLQYATKFANAPQASTGYALNSKAVGYLSTQKATTGQYLWDPAGGLTNDSPDRLKGRAYAESQQLRSTLTKGTSAGICSELVYGNFQELLIGEWGVTEIALNPFDSVGFTTGDVILRMFQTVDIGVRHAASFAVMSDALTPGF